MGKKQGSQLWAYYVKYAEKQLVGLTQNISNWLPLGEKIIAFFFFVLVTLLTLYFSIFFQPKHILQQKKKEYLLPPPKKTQAAICMNLLNHH